LREEEREEEREEKRKKRVQIKSTKGLETKKEAERAEETESNNLGSSQAKR
jgi:hypothetical protein